MSTLSDVRAAWPLISSQGAALSGNWRYLSLKRRVPNGEVLAALDDQGRRHILIPVTFGASIVADRRSRGIHILERELLRKSDKLKFVDVACLEPVVNALFDEVAAGMLAELKPDTNSPAAVCRSVLEGWRTLIDKAPPDQLSREALVGLFGELHFLHKLAQINPDCLSVWTGPGVPPGRHDFRRDDYALEIKTTSTRIGRTCEIHGLLQLEPPPGGTLALCFVRVELAEAGRSVPALIDEIISAGVPRIALLEKLALLKYSTIHEPDYRSIRFSILEEHPYIVGADFPRIVATSFTGGQLPPGVNYVNYGIDLSMAPPFPMATQDFSQLLHSLAMTSVGSAL